MRLKTLGYLAFALCSLSLFSCNRDDDDDNTPIAGKGGNATLRATAQHHGLNIDSCQMFIKYNTTDAPTTFDDSVWCTMVAGKPVAVFSQLKAGKYYLLAKGWDPSISEAVKGGIPYTITEEKSIDLTVPVTEDH